MTVTYTATYGISRPDDLTPIADLAAIVSESADTIEAALIRGGIAPPGAADLAAIAGRVSALEARATTLEARATALETLPVCVARQTTVQTIAPNTWVPLNFQLTDYDPDGLFTASSPSRVTIKKKGLYRLDGGATYGTIATTVRIGAQWQKNGVALPLGTKNIPGSGGPTSTADAVSLPVVLLPGDYVSLATVQTAGAGGTTTVAADGASYLSVQCVRLLP